MMPMIYCTSPNKGKLSFFLDHNGNTYYLFQQPYRNSVCAFFGRGVILDEVFSYSRAKRNPRIVKTMSAVSSSA